MNRLSKETSPYLLQHAHNPVDWYAWGDEAFAKARDEDKPLLVSIGYSTCHWCHVMERESFENTEVAALMNEYFVCIKVDREERPDIDAIYMDAIQAMAGSGGWPLNCFITPDGRPFYGGTYFPPVNAYQRPSWKHVLMSLHDAWTNKRDIIEEQAEKLSEHIQRSVDAMLNTDSGNTVTNVFNPSFAENTYYHLRDRFDRAEGGFGGAPKFPGAMSISFLLDYHYFTRNEEALEHALFSLDKMIHGGIYDQLGGGFARYATDREWLIPHFEKMLYDNALLISALSDAYKCSKREVYKETVAETVAWLQREMTDADGLFFSAQDADSEGVEGKFFVWTKTEVDALLGNDAELFSAFYDVTAHGNWEETNILHRPLSFEAFAESNALDLEQFKATMKKCRDILFATRHKRIYPGLDNKVLLDWNALMISALCDAYKAFGVTRYKEMALRALDKALVAFRKEEYSFYHTFTQGQAKTNAFLDDYANLIAALLDAYTISFNPDYLTEAEAITEQVFQNFYDERDGVFFFTPIDQKDLLVRRKDLYDNATPSGNATMALNLLRLGQYFGNDYYASCANQMLLATADASSQYPNAFARWAKATLYRSFPVHEIAVVGTEYEGIANTIAAKFLPGTVLMACDTSDDRFPLLFSRGESDLTPIYKCYNYTCDLPVYTVEELNL